MGDGEDCYFQLSLTTNSSDLPSKISETCQKNIKLLTSENDAGMFEGAVEGPISNICYGGGLLTA